MTTWTMEQVGQVSRLWARVDVAVELIARYPEAAEAEVRGTLSKRLVGMAQTFAAEVDPRDCALVVEDNPRRPWVRSASLHWQPDTNRVELRGGAADGQFLAVRDAGRIPAIRVPVSSQAPWMDVDAATSVSALAQRDVTYELVGWDETERCWVYQVKP